MLRCEPVAITQGPYSGKTAVRVRDTDGNGDANQLVTLCGGFGAIADEGETHLIHFPQFEGPNGFALNAVGVALDAAARYLKEHQRSPNAA